MLVALALFFFILSLGCGGSVGSSGGGTEGEDSGDGSSGEGEDVLSSGECDGFCGTESTAVTVDLTNAQALFTVQDSDTGSSGALVALLDSKGVTINSSSPLFAVTPEGIQGIMTALDPQGEDAIDGLPRLSLIAVSPIGEVVLAFEHSWIYRDSYEDGEDVITIDQYSDPWAPSSPFTCQIFVVNHLIGAESSGEDDGMNLVCLKNDIELNTYDARTKRIQFDDTGNIYFAAHTSGNWKDVLYKYETTQSADAPQILSGDTVPEEQISEVINANICFREFLTTAAGGVLYTGVTSTSGDCSGDNFFRFVTPDDELQQITSGWWDYTFAPVEDSLKNGTEDNDYFVGDILFYGPDPEVATTPDWDDSCLFRFDPEAEGAERSTKIADCHIDVWRYINFDDDGESNSDAVRQSRCQEEKNMMGGGNPPDKILLANTQDGDELNEIYVVGNVNEKSANDWKCDLCTDGSPDAYCRVGQTLHFEAATSGACATLGGSWSSDENCYNNQIDSDETGNVCGTTRGNWRVNSQWCEFGNGGLDTRAAFSRVDENFDGSGNNRIVRLSDDNEIVSDGWAVGDRLAYVAFNVDSGDYELREVGNAGVLLTGIEVYELMQDPRDETLWFFNGLRFSDNSYVLGTFNPDADDPEATLSVETGLTGQIDTLVIVPSL